jgi:hypothetical protein
MQYTGSISRGKPAEKHNTRENYEKMEQPPSHIDLTRTSDNVVLVNRSLEEVYQECFGRALEEYNQKQIEKGHKERCIDNYLEKVEGDKKLQPMYEFVIQVGNMDEHPDAETATSIYSDWLREFESKYGEQFAVKQAIIHLDEKVPHMHFETVPCAESKRGLAVQNSLNKAIQQAGFSDYKTMLAGWDEILTERMKDHSIERVAGDREKQLGGVDIHTYKRSVALQTELKDLELKREEIQAQIESERARLEYLRLSAREISQEVDAMAAAVTKIDQLESASRREFGTRCREITAECNSYTATINRGIGRLRERINTVRERIQTIKEQMQQRFSLDARKRQAREVSQGMYQQHRSRGRDAGLER